MKFYKILFALILMFVVIGAVSAADDINDTVSSDIQEDTLHSNQTCSFTDLNENISRSSNVIELSEDYGYENGTDELFMDGIKINRSDYVINGNNHVIDAKGKASIFDIKAKNLTINNLVLKNARGFCLQIEGGFVTTNNLTFINCSQGAVSSAVYVSEAKYVSNSDTFTAFAQNTNAIYSELSNVTVANGMFEGNNALGWGLIYAEGSYLEIFNTTFTNCSSNYATAVFSTGSAVVIVNSRFINLNANVTAGALGFKKYNYVIIGGCEFINVTSSKNGGAIFADLHVINMSTPVLYINNTNFTNCSSMYGGAVLVLDGQFELYNCRLEDNLAEFKGGAVYVSNADASIANCTFNMNSVRVYPDYPTYGGALYCDCSDLELYSSSFTNNYAYEAGGVLMYDTKYYLADVEFSGNGITGAIRSYFDNETSTAVNLYGTDKITDDDFENVHYPSYITGTGIPIVLINQTNVTDIPPVYDLRKLNLTTPVKDQGYNGACWAFGMNAALESAILMKMGMTTDFSENNLQNLMLVYSPYGDTNTIEGGYNNNAMAYYLSWLGGFCQDFDTYDELGKISPFITTDQDLHVMDMIIIPHTPGNNESITNVKKAIMQYGALAAYVLSKASGNDEDSKYYNQTTYGEYNPHHEISNHAVCVVGWDDTYSRYNFTLTPPGDGAWIVKNSWGTDWGDEGYFYVSYYDETFCAFPDKMEECFVAISFDNTISYNRNYQYDFSGLARFFHDEDSDRLAYANKFESQGDDVIAAVGTYFESAGIEYTIEIEVNDNEVYTQKGVSPYYGYHTIKLDKYISIAKGDTFIVTVYSNALPICEDTRVHFPKQVTFGLFEDGTVQDLSADYMAACLKVYTLSNQYNVSNIVEYYSANKPFTVDVNQSGVNVTIKLDGKAMTATSDNKGIATFKLGSLSVGIHKIETIYNGTRVLSTVKVLHTIDAADSVTVAYNTKLELTVTYLDKNGKPLASKKVKFTYDGKTMEATTDKKGQILLTVDDNIGTHTLKYTNPSTSETLTAKVKVVSRFSGNKNINMYYFDGTKYTVRVYGDWGKPEGKNHIVTIKIDKKTYKVKTNKNGYATLKIPKTVTPGSHKITATYVGQTVKNTLKIKQVLKTKKTVKVKKSAKKLILKATLKNGKKPIKGKKVTFKIIGKTYKAKTNKKGIAKVTVKKNVIKKLKKGKTYTVKVTYLKDTIKTKVKVR